MRDFTSDLIDLFTKIHPLDRVPRSGYLLRGVTEPESVAAHSHALSLLVLLVTDQAGDTYDRKKALSMAILNDLPEAVTMDIPMPAGDRYMKEAKGRAEQAVMENLFAAFPPEYAELHRELDEAKTPEARLVKGLDKVQMMIKVLCYEREGRGNLSEFWEYERNFADYGVPEVRELFDAVREARGR